MIGWIGKFGWLELNAPVGVVSFWMPLIFVVTGCVLLFAQGRPRRAAPMLALSRVATPAVLQIQIVSERVIIWKGRHILALITPFMFLAGAALDRSLTGPISASGRKALSAVGVTAAVAHMLTIVGVKRRYTTGLSLEDRWMDMLAAPEWQPPFGIATVVIVFTATSVIAAVLLRRHVNENDLPPAEGLAANPFPEQERLAPSRGRKDDHA